MKKNKKKLESLNFEKFNVSEEHLNFVKGGAFSGYGTTTTSTTVSTVHDSGFEDSTTTTTTCECDPCPDKVNTAG